MRKMPNDSRGFTLIEVMIVVAIIAILAAVALPSYQQYVIRGNRAAAQAEMMEIANREQQYFLANRQYADQATLGYTLSSKVASNYTFAFNPAVDNTATPPSFTIYFTAIGSQASDGDLQLSSTGVKTPSGKW